MTGNQTADQLEADAAARTIITECGAREALAMAARCGYMAGRRDGKRQAKRWGAALAVVMLVVWAWRKRSTTAA